MKYLFLVYLLAFSLMFFFLFSVFSNVYFFVVSLSIFVASALFYSTCICLTCVKLLVLFLYLTLSIFFSLSRCRHCFELGG